MNSFMNNATVIPIGVFHYFTLGKREEEALALLLSSQAAFPTMFPRVDYREVHFWYESFGRGNFDLSQVPDINPVSRLENVAVFDQIVNGVSAQDQASLRQVCAKTKGKIDLLNRLFGLIQIRMTANSVVLLIRRRVTEDCYNFEAREDGCVITHNGVATQSEMSFIEAALDTYNTSIQPLHTKVDKLVIKYNREVIAEPDRQQLMTGLATVMGRLRERLHVSCLEINIRTPDELNGILGGIRQGSLKVIEAAVVGAVGNRFMISECTHLPAHWEHLQSFTFEGQNLDLEVASLARIPYVCVGITNIRVEELVEYKNALLQNSNLNKHTIYTPFGIDRDGLRAALEPFTAFVPVFDETPTRDGSFSYPEPSQDRLEFQIGNPIVFAKIKL